VKVSGNKLLFTLESVSPGLAAQERLEQSSRFIFRNGRVQTYNEDVFCSAPVPALKGITAAIPGKEMLAALAKLCRVDRKDAKNGLSKEDLASAREVELEITLEGGKLKLDVLNPPREDGKQTVTRGCHLAAETEIHLQIDMDEKPEDWKPLPSLFKEAVADVGLCAAKRSNNWANTCLRFTPTYVEACDNFQMARKTFKTRIVGEVLVKAEAIKPIAKIEATELSQGKNWLHFRNEEGVRLSCRLYTDQSEFVNLDQLLEIKGTKANFPSELKEAASTAEEFSKQNADDNYVSVELHPAKGSKKRRNLLLRGEGPNGGYWEKRNVAYEGEPISFMIAPALLCHLVENYRDGYLIDGNERLIATKDNYVYVICLCTLAEDEEAELVGAGSAEE